VQGEWLYLAAILDPYMFDGNHSYTLATTRNAHQGYDDAPMESFLSTLKSESVPRCGRETRNEARPDVFLHMETFCDIRHRHLGLGHLRPDAGEQLHC
jgi:hypothetical protein